MYGQQVHLVLVTGMLMRSFEYLLFSIASLILISYLLCFCIYIVNVRPPLEDALRVFLIANVNKEGVPCRHVQPIGKVEPVSFMTLLIYISNLP